MDMQYYGGNCVVFSTKGARLVFDDNLSELGLKSVMKAQDVVVYTGAHGLPEVETRLVIDGPGEYEVSGLSIVGIASRGHMDVENTHRATMYKVITDEATYLIIGHVYPELNDKQLEKIGMIDVLIVPVGGNGYTLDPIGALQLIKKIEPKIVIPTHYADIDNAITYPVEQQTLEQVLKALGMETKEMVQKFHYKPLELTGATQLLLVTRS
jgi:L-ascorbate metabolism protein UlaG (beta-lactamase superfamily)